MGIDQPKIIRTLRLSLTCLVLFLVMWYYQVPERIWSIITVWFVMTEYTSVGGVFKKSFYRFSGTFLSAVYGVVVIYCFENNVMINIIAFMAGVFVYMYYFLDGEKAYIAVIGSVTLSIVLLNHNDLDVAILRTFNIIIGILASMFMIRFFYPKYARDEVMDAQVGFIKQLSNIVDSYLDKSRSLATVKDDYLKSENNILKALVSFDRHISEAKIEMGTTSRYIACNLVAIEHVRHLFRLLSVFVSYLTTDEMRSDAWISKKLNQLLFDFRAIQRRLDHATGLSEQPSGSVIDGKTLPESGSDSPVETVIEVDQNNQPVRIILTTMIKEVNLLREELNKVVLIYDEDNANKNIRFWNKRGVLNG